MLFKSKSKKKGTDSVVSSSDILNEEIQLHQNEEEEIETSLSILPDWLDSPEKEYVLRFLNNECTPLKPNQISLSGIDLEQDGDGDIIVTAFVRSSLNKPIRLESASIVLISEQGERLARKVFDFTDLGEIPPRSSRPWYFVFSENEVLSESIPKEGWKLAFELKKEHALDLDNSWEKSLAEEDKEKLQHLLTTIQAPKPGEINFMGLQARQVENRDLHITLLIRNGSDKNIKIESLPLTIEDASGEVIAKGGFQLNDFEVKANTSKPWTFIFPSSLVLKEQPDFSKWKAYPPQ
jgi:accessory Sec system S-layer assembly protein